ncbi:hypothetical protein [Streptomyces pini]|uniref:Integral membrane protein n=1 Tax=Streptomyces pini TaxID=1520580 RepID=A0A1I4CU42_9ACTN|nr:hypothetical protein [Streptomyces pini]SFK84425.1 hypothetical protein SAMN05192584_109133 [Streptomyces pini]
MPENRPAPPAGQRGGQGEPALELLVHGVGGTTPQEMLGDPRTVRITGDDTAGIHRRTEDADAESRFGEYKYSGGLAADRSADPRTGPPADRVRQRPIPEAYCWSNLTSGNGARALWLLLLPFMVANLAHWMRPAAPARHRGQRVYDVLVRLVALSLTVLLTAAACEVALDLVAWQCAASERCARGKSWLGPLTEGWWAEPGRRLVLAALVPAALTALLWWLSHRTWSAYESASPPPRPPGPARPLPGGERPALSLPGFWYGRRLVSRLRAAHTAAGLLTVATALLAATAAHDLRPGGGTAAQASGRALAAVLAAGWAATVLVAVRKGRTESEPDERIDRWASTVLPGAALGALALTAVYAAWPRPGWTSSAQLPGTGVFAWLALLQGALAAAIAVTAYLLHRASPPGSCAGRCAMGGLGGAAVALLACALGGVLTGGVAQRVADWLDKDGTPGVAGGAIAGPPVLLSWQAAAIPVLLLVVTVFVLGAAVRAGRTRRRLTPQIVDSYEGEPRELESRSRRIARVVAWARLTDSAPALIASVTVATVLLGAGALAGAARTGLPPGPAAAAWPGPLPALAQAVQGLGSWLMGAMVVLLVAMGRRAYRDAAARRTVGILWDVGTFWPRAAHPFAPPCYAERAVPDLTWRMCTWTARTGGRLVISGHSQGSVLAAAAVWQLDPDTRGRVALLTYGSPLERLYGRWFPACFGPAPLRALSEEVDCWRNLWRLTDPIGGPVMAGEDGGQEVDRGPLRDPLHYGRTPEHPLPAPILGHGDYQADPAFDAERAALLDRLDRLSEGDEAPCVPAQPERGPEPRPGRRTEAGPAAP